MPPLGPQEVAPAQPEPRGSRPAAARIRCSTSCCAAGLGQGRELLVGDEPGRERDLGAEALAQAAMNPEGVGFSAVMFPLLTATLPGDQSRGVLESSGLGPWHASWAVLGHDVEHAGSPSRLAP